MSPKQIDLEIDNNLDIPIIIDEDGCAQSYQFSKKYPTEINFQYMLSNTLTKSFVSKK